MALARKQARKTMEADVGGPFGAAITDGEGHLLSVASNSVLGDHDPTAHAEINAIRQACAKRRSHDLSGCVLYTTCHPCPMCLGAILWANIHTVYYGCSALDAEGIGFRDAFIHRFIQGGCKNTTLLLQLLPEERKECLKLFEDYVAMEKSLY